MRESINISKPVNMRHFMEPTISYEQKRKSSVSNRRDPSRETSCAESSYIPSNISRRRHSSANVQASTQGMWPSRLVRHSLNTMPRKPSINPYSAASKEKKEFSMPSSNVRFSNYLSDEPEGLLFKNSSYLLTKQNTAHSSVSDRHVQCRRYSRVSSARPNDSVPLEMAVTNFHQTLRPTTSCQSKRTSVNNRQLTPAPSNVKLQSATRAKKPMPKVCNDLKWSNKSVTNIPSQPRNRNSEVRPNKEYEYLKRKSFNSVQNARRNPLSSFSNNAMNLKYPFTFSKNIIFDQSQKDWNVSRYNMVSIHPNLFEDQYGDSAYERFSNQRNMSLDLKQRTMFMTESRPIKNRAYDSNIYSELYNQQIVRKEISKREEQLKRMAEFQKSEKLTQMMRKHSDLSLKSNLSTELTSKDNDAEKNKIFYQPYEDSTEPFWESKFANSRLMFNTDAYNDKSASQLRKGFTNHTSNSLDKRIDDEQAATEKVHYSTASDVKTPQQLSNIHLPKNYLIPDVTPKSGNTYVSEKSTVHSNLYLDQQNQLIRPFCNQLLTDYPVLNLRQPYQPKPETIMEKSQLSENIDHELQKYQNGGVYKSNTEKSVESTKFCDLDDNMVSTSASDVNNYASDHLNKKPSSLYTTAKNRMSHQIYSSDFEWNPKGLSHLDRVNEKENYMVLHEPQNEKSVSLNVGFDKVSQKENIKDDLSYNYPSCDDTKNSYKRQSSHEISENVYEASDEMINNSSAAKTRKYASPRFSLESPTAHHNKNELYTDKQNANFNLNSEISFEPTIKSPIAPEISLSFKSPYARYLQNNSHSSLDNCSMQQENYQTSTTVLEEITINDKQSQTSNMNNSLPLENVDNQNSSRNCQFSESPPSFKQNSQDFRQKSSPFQSPMFEQAQSRSTEISDTSQHIIVGKKLAAEFSSPSVPFNAPLENILDKPLIKESEKASLSVPRENSLTELSDTNLPELPTDTAPQTPAQNAPNTSSLIAPHSPSLIAPHSPSLNAFHTPSMDLHHTPSMNSHHTPSLNAPLTPSLNAPLTPSLNAPVTPSLNAPLTPSLNTPVTPSLDVHQMHLMNASHKSVINEYQSPTVIAPQTPPINNSQARSKDASQTPSLNKPVSPMLNASDMPISNPTNTILSNDSPSLGTAAFYKAQSPFGEDCQTFSVSRPKPPSSSLFSSLNQSEPLLFHVDRSSASNTASVQRPLSFAPLSPALQDTQSPSKSAYQSLFTESVKHPIINSDTTSSAIADKSPFLDDNSNLSSTNKLVNFESPFAPNGNSFFPKSDKLKYATKERFSPLNTRQLSARSIRSNASDNLTGTASKTTSQVSDASRSMYSGEECVNNSIAENLKIAEFIGKLNTDNLKALDYAQTNSKMAEPFIENNVDNLSYNYENKFTYPQNQLPVSDETLNTTKQPIVYRVDIFAQKDNQKSNGGENDVSFTPQISADYKLCESSVTPKFTDEFKNETKDYFKLSTEKRDELLKLNKPSSEFENSNILGYNKEHDLSNSSEEIFNISKAQSNQTPLNVSVTEANLEKVISPNAQCNITENNNFIGDVKYPKSECFAASNENQILNLGVECQNLGALVTDPFSNTTEKNNLAESMSILQTMSGLEASKSESLQSPKIGSSNYESNTCVQSLYDISSKQNNLEYRNSETCKLNSPILPRKSFSYSEQEVAESLSPVNKACSSFESQTISFHSNDESSSYQKKIDNKFSIELPDLQNKVVQETEQSFQQIHTDYENKKPSKIDVKNIISKFEKKEFFSKPKDCPVEKLGVSNKSTVIDPCKNDFKFHDDNDDYGEIIGFKPLAERIKIFEKNKLQSLQKEVDPIPVAPPTNNEPATSDLFKLKESIPRQPELPKPNFFQSRISVSSFPVIPELDPLRNHTADTLDKSFKRLQSVSSKTKRKSNTFLSFTESISTKTLFKSEASLLPKSKSFEATIEIPEIANKAPIKEKGDDMLLNVVANRSSTTSLLDVNLMDSNKHSSIFPLSYQNVYKEEDDLEDATQTPLLIKKNDLFIA